MTIFKEAVSRFRPEVRRQKRREALIDLANQAMPEFKRLLDHHVRIRKSMDPNRLRYLLEKDKAVVVFVDRSKDPVFRVVSNSNGFGQVFLAVVIDPAEFLGFDAGQRNNAMVGLFDQFSKVRARLKPDLVMSRLHDDTSYFARELLNGNRIDPRKAVIRFYD